MIEQGFLAVDEHCRTNVPHIYAVGDVIGPPALAASSMEQGRRAVCHLLGLDPGASAETIPVGIYAIPEMAGVGLSEAQAHGPPATQGAPRSRGRLSPACRRT